MHTLSDPFEPNSPSSSSWSIHSPTKQEAILNVLQYWCMLFTIPFALMLLESACGKFGYHERLFHAWGWFLATFLPAMSVILLTYYFSAQSATRKSQLVIHSKLLTLKILTCFHFFLITISLLCRGEFSASEMIRLSLCWLAPSEIIVCSVVLVFLTTSDN